MYIWDDCCMVLLLIYFMMMLFENWICILSELLGFVEFDLDWWVLFVCMCVEFDVIMVDVVNWDGWVKVL